MKTQKLKSVKMLSTSMLVAAVLTMSACHGQQEKSVKEVIDSSNSKTEVQAPNIDIHAAALMGELEAVQQHIKAGTDINKKEPLGGSTPLITAAVFGKTGVVQALIEAGADLNIRNNEGSTALHSAAFFCRTDIVQALLAKGADTSIKNKMGSTAFQSVAGPFDQVKPIYNFIGKQLGPLGLKLDYTHLETTRPIIAELLK